MTPNQTARRVGRRARARNPLAGFIGWFMAALFGLLGVTVSIGQDWPSTPYVQPGIFLLGGLVGTAWTQFEVRSGRISMVSKSDGKVYVYERRKEPVLFFFVVFIYLAAGIGATLAGVVFLFS